MATAFTHALLGGALAGAASGPTLRLGFVLAALSVLPDADVISFRLGIPYEHPLGHRGLTHSLPFAALCGLATPWLAGGPRFAEARAWRSRVALGFAATASHGLLDALTNGGLGVGFFVPLSGERFFFGWRPLLVSPLSPMAFFTPTGARILASEILWVWLPLAGLVAAVWLGRRRVGA